MLETWVVTLIPMRYAALQQKKLNGTNQAAQALQSCHASLSPNQTTPSETAKLALLVRAARTPDLSRSTCNIPSNALRPWSCRYVLAASSPFSQQIRCRTSRTKPGYDKSRITSLQKLLGHVHPPVASRKDALSNTQSRRATVDGETHSSHAPAVRRGSKFNIMRAYAEFISVPTSDTSGTVLLLHFDDKRYLFGNVPEGIQRASTERGLRLQAVSDIFLTGKTEWKNNGGLLGMMLTLVDTVVTSASAALHDELQKIDRLERQLKVAENPKLIKQLKSRLEKRREDAAALPEKAEKSAALNLHGSTNLAHTLATARKYVCRKGMPLEIDEFGDGGRADADQERSSKPTWSDDHIKVWALPVYPSITAPSSPKSGPKRDFSEFQESTASAIDDQSHNITQSDYTTCKEIVRGMFHSTWEPNDMEEFRLAEAPSDAALFIRDADTNETKKYTGPKAGEDGADPDLEVLARKPWPGALIDRLPPTSPSRCSMSYIFRNHDSRGKFDITKARALNVTPGPAYASLARGESVTSSDGQTVTPDMVLEPDRPGQGIAVVEIPTKEYVENFVSRPEWKSEEPMKGIAVFIWNLGRGVGDHPLLREFIAGMPQCKHIFSSKDYCANSLVFKGVGKVTAEFASINGKQYGVPFHDNEQETLELSANDNKKLDIRAAQPGLKIHLLPKFEIGFDSEEKSSKKQPVEPEEPKQSDNDSVNTNEPFGEPEVKDRLASMRHPLPGIVEIGGALGGAGVQKHTQSFQPGDPDQLVADAAKIYESMGLSKDRMRLANLRRALEGATKVRESLDEPEVKERMANMRQTLPNGDAEIITLGTGSSLPSRYRNVSATLLRVPGQGSYLLDCGEGTLGQLERTLGRAGMREVLRDLKMIWISHLHADHHLGIATVIKAWYEEVFQSSPPPTKPTSQDGVDLAALFQDKKLVIVAERAMLNWLGEYASVENYGYDRTVLLEPVMNDDPDADPALFGHTPRDSNGQIVLDSDNNATRTICKFDGTGNTPALLRKATGLSSLLAVRVRHCLGAHAVSLVFPSGFKLSYSGDCRPSQKFAQIGHGSTVLLHEATFEDELIREAIAKRHSTISEALGIAKAMEAKVVVLTHFSQRYRHMPEVDKTFRGSSALLSGVLNEKDTDQTSLADKTETEAKPDAASIPNAVRDIPVSETIEDGDLLDDTGPDMDDAISNIFDRTDDGPLDAPVVLAFDHMRLRVEDALAAEAYEPVFRKHLKRTGSEAS